MVHQLELYALDWFNCLDVDDADSFSSPSPLTIIAISAIRNNVQEELPCLSSISHVVEDIVIGGERACLLYNKPQAENLFLQYLILDRVNSLGQSSINFSLLHQCLLHLLHGFFAFGLHFLRLFKFTFHGLNSEL